MLQIIYVSTARTYIDGSRAGILEQSRRNNRCNGITGLLLDDDVRFLQVLEGPENVAETVLARIMLDVRHRALIVLSKRSVAKREFDELPMASLSDVSDPEIAIRQLDALASRTSFDFSASLTRYRSSS